MDVPKAEVIDSYPYVTTHYLVGASTFSTTPTPGDGDPPKEWMALLDLAYYKGIILHLLPNLHTICVLNAFLFYF